MPPWYSTTVFGGQEYLMINGTGRTNLVMTYGGPTTLALTLGALIDDIVVLGWIRMERERACDIGGRHGHLK
jgi:hypothetical protein